MSDHAAPHPPAPVEAMLTADPDLWLVTANMREWSVAHPCECEALCECEKQR